MDAIKFGKFLASLRTEKKLTQEELAEKLFIDKRKVSRWECGMSIPDFETIIKLSEILNVTPYEFSICQRLEKEKLSKKVINKFKNIKDFKNYKLKKKILIILLILLGILFIFNTIYTFKYYGKVEIYEFRSLDDKYFLNGTYIYTNDFSLYDINDIYFNKDFDKVVKNLSKCNYEIFYNDIRLMKFSKDKVDINKKENNSLYTLNHNEFPINEYIDKPLTFKISCLDDYPVNEILIKFKLIKKYDNKLL